MKNLKRNKGITLVALVITIIVLLILAGVTLNLVMGDSGIFGKAKNAKTLTNQTHAVEEIKLAILEVQTEKASKGEIATLKDLTEELQKKVDEYDIDVFSTESARINIKTGSDINLQTEAKRIRVTNKTKYGVEVEVTNTFQVSLTGATTTPTNPGGDTPTPPAVTEYTVTFNTNGGSSVASQQVVSGGTATRPETDPTKADNNFVNWYSNSELTTAYDFTTPVTGDITIYAKWEEVVSSPFTVQAGQSVTTTGTLVTLGTEQFYVIGTENGNIKLLAAQNVNTTNNTQGSGNTVRFDDNSTTYAGSEIERYVNNYVANLKSTYGLPSSATGRLMSLDEVVGLGGDTSSASSMECPTWVNSHNGVAQPYWLGTDEYNRYVFRVYGGSYSLGSTDYDDSGHFGVRPVIIVSQSDF